jgi:hypothetical protein
MGGGEIESDGCPSEKTMAFFWGPGVQDAAKLG